MPTYEYRCLDCNFQFELFQSMKDSPLKECPRCKGRVKRLIGSGAGFIFKGPGFFITDYKRKPSGDKQASKNNQQRGKSSPSESNSSS